MYRGYTMVMLFLSYITDYIMLNSLWVNITPAYGFHELAMSSLNQTEWWRQRDQNRKQTNTHLRQTEKKKQAELRRRQAEVQQQAKIPLWRAGAEKQTEIYVDRDAEKKQAKLPLWDIRGLKQVELDHVHAEVQTQDKRQIKTRKQKKKKKSQVLSAPITTASYTPTNDRSGTVKITALPNKNPRKQFQKGRSQFGVRFNQSQKLQNQWPTLSPGQLALMRFQRDPIHMKSQVDPFQWEHQKISMQLQNQSNKSRRYFQNQLGPIRSRGQMAPVQLQRDPSWKRGQINSTQYQNNSFQSEIISQNYQSKWSSKQSRREMNPNQLNIYRQMQYRGNTGASHWGQQTGPNQFQNQGNPQIGAYLQQGEERVYRHPAMPISWNSYSKKLALRQYPLIPTPKPKKTGTRSKKSTYWENWIPPHLIDDEYYPDSITPKPKGKGGGAGLFGEDTGAHFPGGQGHGGWGPGYYDGYATDAYGNTYTYVTWQHGYHPQEPRFDMTATIAKSTTLTPTTTQTVYWQRKRKTSVPPRAATGVHDARITDYCNHLRHWCMRGYLTGSLCARTVFFTYLTFPNYCLMDYINCVEQLEAPLKVSILYIHFFLVWMVVHMGVCYEAKPLSKHYVHYQYKTDYFLDDFMLEQDALR